MIISIVTTDSIIVIIILLMKSHNSSFLLTDQVRYSEELFAKSINRVRNRINILSTSSITTDMNCPQNTNKSYISKGNKSSGLSATISKLTFDLEIIDQDLRVELLQLKKGRQLLQMIGDEVRKKSKAAQRLTHSSLQQLQKDAQSIITANSERSKRLVIQCELRRQKGSALKQKMGELSRRIGKIQGALGCFTANQKFYNPRDQ